LVIPALGIDAPVVEVPIANKTWNVSLVEHEIAHLGGTAHPGEKNNMVLAGHATLKRGIGPFFRLESLQPGDIAVVYAGEQPFRYRVLGKRYVLPTEVSVAQPTVDAILTLVTCSDWDAEDRTYRERVAVIAELVSDEMP
jgi:sortase A